MATDSRGVSHRVVRYIIWCNSTVRKPGVSQSIEDHGASAIHTTYSAKRTTHIWLLLLMRKVCDDELIANDNTIKPDILFSTRAMGLMIHPHLFYYSFFQVTFSIVLHMFLRIIIITGTLIHFQLLFFLYIATMIEKALSDIGSDWEDRFMKHYIYFSFIRWVIAGITGPGQIIIMATHVRFDWWKGLFNWVNRLEGTQASFRYIFCK